jgi:hypothetical protein
MLLKRFNTRYGRRSEERTRENERLSGVANPS